MPVSAPSRVVTYSEAVETVRSYAARWPAPSSTESLPLLDGLDRTLAAPVLADRDQPPFARSTRDGYACRAAELTGGGALRVVGQLRAGEFRTEPVPPGEAIEIMTGAPVPPGADCVVMLEHIAERGGSIQFEPGRSIEAGANIVPAGAEARAGDVVLPAGTRMAARHIGVAAACGAAQVTVCTRPRVAILPTGDELVEAAERPRPHQIRNSNSYSLAAQVLAAGAEPVRLAIARDEPAHLATLLRTALDADLLLLSGGVSMGRYDFVEEVLSGLGAEFFFTGALIQPGKPVVFGQLPRAARAPLPFFGLPGNPVSTLVTFALFAEPLLAVLAGQPWPGAKFALARLSSAQTAKPGLTRFLPARLTGDSPSAEVAPVVWQGSGDLAAAARANCFLVVPPDRPTLAAGETVSVLLA